MKRLWQPEEAEVDSLAGTWSAEEAAEFDAALSDQRHVDEDLWERPREVMRVPRWSCAMGHRLEADTEEELVRKVQEHMRKEHGMEMSEDRIRRDLREEN